METKKGMFIVISGLSGTGKNFFQDLILGSSNEYQQVPKYTTRSKRESDQTSIDMFDTDKDKIDRLCTWKYRMNGNQYGIRAEDVERIIKTREKRCCYSVRLLCFNFYQTVL